MIIQESQTCVSSPFLFLSRIMLACLSVSSLLILDTGPDKSAKELRFDIKMECDAAPPTCTAKQRKTCQARNKLCRDAVTRPKLSLPRHLNAWVGATPATSPSARRPLVFTRLTNTTTSKQVPFFPRYSMKINMSPHDKACEANDLLERRIALPAR